MNAFNKYTAALASKCFQVRCLMVLIMFSSTAFTCWVEITETAQDAEYEDSESKEFFSVEKSYGKIVYSIMVLKHADQLPEQVLLPTEPEIDMDLDENEYGLLTEDGKTRAFNLGLWARERYNFLINDNKPYSTKLLMMLSSSYDHTVSTGQLFFAGLYPPRHEEDVWNSDILWQPISILSLPRFHDRMILPTEPCDRVNRVVDHIINSPEFRKYYDNYERLLTYIQAHAEIPFATNNMAEILDAIIKVYDWLFVQKQIGLPIPSWAENIYDDLLKHVHFFKKKILNHPELLRLKGGPLLSDIVYELKKKRKKPSSPKVFQFYVGHDSTIRVLLKSLGIPDDHVVHFCATLLFELRMRVKKAPDNHFELKHIVTVSYKNSDDIWAIPELLNLPRCPNPCSLEDFIKATKSITLTSDEWVNECTNSGINYNAMNILF